MTRPAGQAPFAELAGRGVFHAGDVEYTWGDVLLAARIWGDWAHVEKEARHGIACARHLRQTGGRWPREELDTAAEEFRYERDLVSADDMHAWLEQWTLTPEQWLAALRLALACRLVEGASAEWVAHYRATYRQWRSTIKAVAVMSGHLERWARKLAGRAAIHVRHGQQKATADESAKNEPVSYVATEADLRRTGMSPELCRFKLARLAQLEKTFTAFTRQLLTPEAIKDYIQRRYTDWIAVEFSALRFEAEAAAREAAFCIRMDGETFDELSQRCQIPAERKRAYLRELDQDLVAVMLGAEPGALLGPMQANGGAQLLLVHHKTLPTATDPEVCCQVEYSLLQRTIDQDIAQWIRWDYPVRAGR